MTDTPRPYSYCLAISLVVSLSTCPEAIAKTITVSKTIAVGSSPLDAVMTPDGTEVYVSDYGSNTVTVISTATDTVTDTIAVGSSPDALAMSPDGLKVYVGQHGGNVSVIDTVTKTVSTIVTGGPVRDLEITPDGTKVYLAMEFAGLKKITTADGSVSPVSGSVCPEGVGVTPNGVYLYVNYQCGGPGGSGGHDAVGKFDVATDSFIKGITGFPNVGSKIAVSPDGRRVWASDGDACISPAYDHKGCPAIPYSVVNIIRTSTDTLQRSMGVPGAVGFFPDNSFIFIGGPTLLILDKSMVAFANLNVSSSGSVAVTPDKKKAYVPNPSANTVTVLSITK